MKKFYNQRARSSMFMSVNQMLLSALLFESYIYHMQKICTRLAFVSWLGPTEIRSIIYFMAVHILGRQQVFAFDDIHK